jgi:hypothetical protein
MFVLDRDINLGSYAGNSGVRTAQIHQLGLLRFLLATTVSPAGETIVEVDEAVGEAFRRMLPNGGTYLASYGPDGKFWIDLSVWSGEILAPKIDYYILAKPLEDFNPYWQYDFNGFDHQVFPQNGELGVLDNGTAAACVKIDTGYGTNEIQHRVIVDLNGIPTTSEYSPPEAGTELAGVAPGGFSPRLVEVNQTDEGTGFVRISDQGGDWVLKLIAPMFLDQLLSSDAASGGSFVAGCVYKIQPEAGLGDISQPTWCILRGGHEYVIPCKSVLCPEQLDLGIPTLAETGGLFSRKQGLSHGEPLVISFE